MLIESKNRKYCFEGNLSMRFLLALFFLFFHCANAVADDVIFRSWDNEKGLDLDNGKGLAFVLNEIEEKYSGLVYMSPTEKMGQLVPAEYTGLFKRGLWWYFLFTIETLEIPKQGICRIPITEKYRVVEGNRTTVTTKITGYNERSCNQFPDTAATYRTVKARCNTKTGKIEGNDAFDPDYKGTAYRSAALFGSKECRYWIWDSLGTCKKNNENEWWEINSQLWSQIGISKTEADSLCKITG